MAAMPKGRMGPLLRSFATDAHAAGSCVVNVASMLTFFGGPRVPVYTASKGGIGQLTKSLAAAWAADGIRVNAVAPGWIATPLTEALHAGRGCGGDRLPDVARRASSPARSWRSMADILLCELRWWAADVN